MEHRIDVAWVITALVSVGHEQMMAMILVKNVIISYIPGDLQDDFRWKGEEAFAYQSLSKTGNEGTARALIWKTARYSRAGNGFIRRQG